MKRKRVPPAVRFAAKSTLVESGCIEWTGSACVNPDHLEPVTQSENLLRAEGVGKGNTRKTHCPQGHPYSGDNLYLAPSRPNRMCRACRRQSKMKGKAA